MDPKNGRYAILWPHGILFRDQEANMRRKMVMEDQIEAVIGLGANLFYNSPMEAMILIGNRCRKSPDYIIENLPPLKVNTHYLLSFHIFEFMENSFIACRICEPINQPLNFYMKDMFIEYRIEEQETRARLWCKLKGYYNGDISSKGFFFILSILNKIMMTRQLKNIKKLSELLVARNVVTRIHDLTSYHPELGIHWWFFCRHHNCKGLIT